MEYYHLSEIIHRQAKKFGDEEAIKVRNEETGTWSSISWSEFSKKVTTVAEALCHIGAKPQANIGIYTQNRAECLFVDFGAFSNRAAMVPMYATASVPQITYMINEAEIEILFVGDQWQYDNAWLVLQENAWLKRLIIFDKKVKLAGNDKQSVYFDSFCSHKNRTSQDIISVEKRIKAAKDEDTAHIIYTSGTTGEPKGVVLTHANYKAVMKTHDIRLDYLPPRYLSVCFLPMAHVFEKAWSIYCLHRGCSLAICSDPKEIQTCIKEVRPQAMCSVPRFWEKVYAGVQEKIDSSGFLMRAFFRNAIKTGRKHNLDYVNNGQKAPWGLRMRFKFYNKMVYTKLKKVVGIENGVIFPAAGAVLSDKINIFLQSVNIPLIYGYGLTETTATVSCFPQVDFEIGTVGKVMPDTEVRIGENNEIQVRGASVMKEYYKKPAATAAVFTEDGFFRTGDAGYLTEKMGIVLTERIKDLYKTSNGKYIAPQQLEAHLIADKYIDSAIVIGDQRKYVTALIIPAWEELKEYARKNQIAFDSEEDLCNNPKIIELFEQRISSMQNEFANYEQIKRFALLSEPFTIQSGELTDTLKMKRAFIADKYKDIIDKMYE
ncbi:long-chain-fatty-acid--CoA ligase [Bacteroidia bacterium]|nr:long-chain-fatty-acid--CoA ligase [Bacteroidia bacterium]GHT48046.1 long-chain-fatty-acid--CoA ligase [Bacteroidia bacterium]